MDGYTAAHRDAALIERTDRAFIRVYGRDPARMIQGLISNDLALASPTRAVYTTVLTPKGKMVCDARVLRVGDELLLETDRAASESLTAHLKKFVPPLFARFEDVTGGWGILGVYGPQAGDVIEQTFGVMLPASMAEDDAVVFALNDAPITAIASSYTIRGGFDVLGASPSIRAAGDRLRGDHVVSLDEAALDVLRIEAGRPRWGFDMDENTIPLEIGLRERAISESKGCYTGQEVIVRILHRGHVNWVMRGIVIGGAEVPARDTALLHPADHRKIGRVTSAVHSPGTGSVIGLGMVRREIDVPFEAVLGDAAGPAVRIVAADDLRAMASRG
jgi:tRNA-modifying protein YgfZ